MKTFERLDMKSKILFISLFIIMIIAVVEGRAQAYTHDPKLISLLPTENKKKEIEVKNDSGIHEVYIIYKYKEDDKYWAEVGTVSVFSNTVAKFYVEEGFNYGANIQHEKPIKLGSEGKKRWRTPKNRDRDNDRD